MKDSFISEIPFSKFSIWNKPKTGKEKLVAFDLEITTRCNNNCRHCCVNVPARDKKAKAKELTYIEIKNIVDQAADLGVLSCLITGGEPLLREDFFDIYLYIKKKGILVSVFTNATLITDKHIRFFKKYSPRNIEVTVYGVTRETYECVTRRSGSFGLFIQGLNLLLNSGIKVQLKTVAIRSNIHELPQIARFCRSRSQGNFFFDPVLNLRFDRNQKRNKEIISERLSPEEIMAVEKAYSVRSQVLGGNLDKNLIPDTSRSADTNLFRFRCGSGSFSVGHDGKFKLCRILVHPDCMYDLKKGSVQKAYAEFALQVRDMRSQNLKFLNRCHTCELLDNCFYCPAQSYLETGELDAPAEYFCDIVRAIHLNNHR